MPCQNLSIQKPRHPFPTCFPVFASLTPLSVPRRTLITLLPAFLFPFLPASAQNYPKLPTPKYDANKSRRYLEIGRPSPDRSPPDFTATPFTVDEDLLAQDLTVGKGSTVERDSLVVARWVMVLADGTTVDDTNERQPALFRAGTHQVPPGIEDAVVGMRVGGVRRICGSSERILAKVSLGYDIGERSLVPNGSKVYVDLSVDRINPYGR